MNRHDSPLGSIAIQLAAIVGEAKRDPRDAANELCQCIPEYLQVSGLHEVWQVSQQANLVLAKMYPEHADVFSSIDHRVPNRTNRVSEVVATRLIARLILTAIINLNGDPNHVAGAKQMYTAIPQPIPYSNTPFSGDGWSVSALNVGRRSRDGGIDPASLTGPMDALPHPDAKDKPDVDQ